MRTLFASVGAVSLAACSGGVDGASSTLHSGTGSTPYTVGGTVSGLTGSGLVLQNNGGNSLSIAADGSFTFTVTQIAGNAYNVTVLGQPTAPSETCVAANATGTIGLADVTTVTITCSAKTTTTDTIGGIVVGLAGSGLVLQNDATDNLAIGADGAFTFATPLAGGMPYAVSVLSPPSNPSQNCVVTAGSGTTSASDINNVTVTCTTTSGAPESIGGSVSGLPAGASLILENNGRDDLMVSADGTFTFKTPVPTGGAFNVTVTSISDAAGSLSCSVKNSGGVVTAAAVTTVAVVCSNNTSVSLVGLQVSAASAIIANGLTSQFTATGIFSDNSTQNVTTQVTWSSSNASVAAITVGGLATATGSGTTTVAATLSGLSASATLRVTAATLASLTIGEATSAIAKGLTDQFTATGNYTDGTTQNLTAQVTWGSSAPTVATIAATGVATGIAVGSTTISAALGTVNSAAVTLTVTPPTLTSIAVTPRNPTILVGASQQFVATGTYTDATMQVLTTQATWASSNAAVVATVPGGLATPTGTGNTIVSATVGSTVGSTQLTVNASITVSAVTSTLPQATNNSLQLQVTIGGVAGSAVNITPDNTVTTVFTAAAGTAYTLSVVQEPGTVPRGGITSTICSIEDGNNGQRGSTVSDTVPGQNLTLTVNCYENPLGFAFVTNFTGNYVEYYLIQSDGTLALFNDATISTGTGPQAAAINGGYLYVANETSSDLSVFSINPNTGELTAVTGSPFDLSLTSPYTLAIGTYGADAALYVTNHTGGCSDTVSAFDIAGGGASLVPINTATTVGPGVNGAVVATTPNASGFDSYYYVLNNAVQGVACNTSNPVSETGVTGFTMNASTPALTFLTQTADANDALYSVTSSPGYLYVGTYDGVIDPYSVQTSGALSIATGLNAFNTSTAVDAVTSVTYVGTTYLYAAGYDGTTASLASFFSAGGAQANTCYSTNQVCLAPTVFGSTPIAGAAALLDPGVGAYLYLAGPNNIYPFLASYNAATGNLEAPAPAMGGASISVTGDQTSIVVEAR